MPTHAEQRVVPYSPEKIFDLVADVERYPQFLPWCLACRIRRHLGPNQFVADLMIGFKVFRERFASEVTLHRPDRIDVVYRDGPFRYLNNHWNFRTDETGRCIIDFYIDFEFRSKTLQTLIGKLFNEAVQRMVNAFEKRAGQLYGLDQVGAARGGTPATKPAAVSPSGRDAT
ncbi:MAG: type II toxin-antitoxin system RatA family toxin [Rhodospirillales bacterium]|nr:type II toxin-antitoxin system RatA family toxin [Rhodospirillales bacterium]